MQNSNIRLNMAAFKHSRIKLRDKQGKEVEGIFIPFDANKIFVGTKGMYFDMVAFPIKKTGESKDTHIIKQSFSKEEREKMTKEQQDNMPIFGNMTDWNYAGSQPNTDSNFEQGITLQISEGDLPY